MVCSTLHITDLFMLIKLCRPTLPSVKRRRLFFFSFFLAFCGHMRVKCHMLEMDICLAQMEQHVEMAFKHDKMGSIIVFFFFLLKLEVNRKKSVLIRMLLPQGC